MLSYCKYKKLMHGAENDSQNAPDPVRSSEWPKMEMENPRRRSRTPDLVILIVSLILLAGGIYYYYQVTKYDIKHNPKYSKVSGEGRAPVRKTEQVPGQTRHVL